MTDVLDLAKRLMAAPSVTPATGAVFDAMEAMLAPLGFEVTRFTRGEGAAGTPEAPVENLFAIRRGPEGSKHFAFAGHLDVVPPGGGWTSEAFEPEVRGELLSRFGLEIGAGLGDFAGKVWRIGLMGYAARAENVRLCLTALETLMVEKGLCEKGVALAAAEPLLAQA